MPGRLMVGHMTLNHVILVQIQARQQCKKESTTSEFRQEP